MSKSSKLAQSVFESENTAKVISNGDQRLERRVKIYKSEKVGVEIFGRNSSLKGFVSDLSSGGFSSVLPMEELLPWVRGDLVQVVISSLEGESLPISAEVLSIAEVSIGGVGHWRVGMRFHRSEIESATITRLIGPLFYIDEFVQPLISIKDTFRVNSLVHGRVNAFGKEGLVFEAAVSDNVFIPGIFYRIKVQLPVGEAFTARAQLVQISYKQESGRLLGYMKFEALGVAAREYISQTLIIGADQANPGNLRKKGYFVGSIEPSTIEMSYPASEGEYREMLELRRKAYQGVGKLLDAKSADEAWDEFDEISRHVIFRVRGKIVGTIRVVFCHQDSTKSEHHKWGVDIPEYVRKAGFVEVSRASVDETFRSTDIFAGLIRNTIRLAVENGVRYVVVSCNPHLVKTYEAIGGQVVGGPFEAFGRNDCSLMVFDIPRITQINRGSLIAFHYTSFPLFWHLFKREPGKYALQAINMCLHAALSLPIRSLVRFIQFRKFKNKEKRV